MCLELMDFDDKERVMQKVAQNGTMQQKLIQYMQMTLMLAQQVRPDMVQGISQDIMKTMGVAGGAALGGSTPNLFESDNVSGLPREEHAFVERARANAQEAAQPVEAAQVKE
jgi:hypothetical protein